jgi:hypothetical protein
MSCTVSGNRVVAFFRGFGFESVQAEILAARFGEGDESLRQARDAVTTWIAKAGGTWAAESPAGFAAARAAFVRASGASRFGTAFLGDDIPGELTAALAQARPFPLPSLVPASMPPQTVDMLVFVDDVLRSVLPLAKRSA